MFVKVKIYLSFFLVAKLLYNSKYSKYMSLTCPKYPEEVWFQLRWIFIGSPVVSILPAVFTVSPLPPLLQTFLLGTLRVIIVISEKAKSISKKNIPYICPLPAQGIEKKFGLSSIKLI